MKRIFSVLLLCLLLVMAALPAGAYSVGDISGDGSVTLEDARGVLRVALELDPVTGERFLPADADGSGDISLEDARTALRIALELDPARTVEEPNGFADFHGDVVDLSVSGYTYAMLRQDLAQLRALFPARFSYASLGVTADGRNIYCLTVGTGHGSRQIVADVGIHASEYLNPPAVMRAVEYYLRNYDTPVYQGKTVRQLLEDTDLYIFPMLNPDGIAISQRGPEGLQNTALQQRVRDIYTAERAAGNTFEDADTYYRVWKANANGVDLNRNYLFSRTGLTYQTGVYRPSGADYAGNRARPEAETAAYIDLLNSLTNPVAAVSIHSQGGLIYWDCGQSAAGKAAAKQLAVTVSGVTGYYLDMSDSFVGALADWVMIEKGIPSVTVETGSGAHNPLPASFLPGIAERLRDVFPAVAAQFQQIADSR